MKGLVKETGSRPTQKGVRRGCVKRLNEKKIPRAWDHL